MKFSNIHPGGSTRGWSVLYTKYLMARDKHTAFEVEQKKKRTLFKTTSRFPATAKIEKEASCVTV